MRVKPGPLVDDDHRWPVGQLPNKSTTRSVHGCGCTDSVHPHPAGSSRLGLAHHALDRLIHSSTVKLPRPSGSSSASASLTRLRAFIASNPGRAA